MRSLESRAERVIETEEARNMSLMDRKEARTDTRSRFDRTAEILILLVCLVQ